VCLQFAFQCSVQLTASTPSHFAESSSCQVFCPGTHTLSALGPGERPLGGLTQSLLTPERRDEESAEFVAEAAKQKATPASVTP
jgi:hypothetical protein